MKTKKFDKAKALVWMSLVLAAGAAVSADPPPVRAFEAVPRQALVELKATVGKPFSSGLVFVDGKFIEPPYKVERYGTAIRINGVQVTDEIIPWSEFLKTQLGARIEKKVEQPAAEQEFAAEPAPQSEAGDSIDDDLDDLFDDNPAPKKKTAKTAPKRASPPRAPVATTTVVLSGEFSHNDKTKAMVARINKMRADIEIALRKGGCFFFGTLYAPMSIDRAPADMFLESIPSVMKANSDFESFRSAARQSGLAYLSEAIMRDLFRNRLDYIRLRSRLRAVREERKWETMLQGAR